LPVDARTLFAAAIALIFFAFCVMAAPLPAAARLLPLVIGIPGTLLAVAVVVQEARMGKTAAAKDIVRAPGEASAISWIATFWLGIMLRGFSAGAPLVTGLYLLIGLRYGVAKSLLAALLCFALTYGLFGVVFHTPLFEGLLARLLPR